MRALFSIPVAFGATLMLASPVSATPVTLGLDFLVTEGTSPAGGSAAGSTFTGSVSYDDDGLELQEDGSYRATESEGGLAFSLTLFDRLITPGTPGFFSDPSEFALLLDASRTFQGIRLFVDEPNTFFFGTEDGTAFAYEFQTPGIDEDGNEFGEAFARGSGTISLAGTAPPPEPGPSPIPLPAGAPLLLLGLAGLAGLRRR